MSRFFSLKTGFDGYLNRALNDTRQLFAYRKSKLKEELFQRCTRSPNTLDLRNYLTSVPHGSKMSGLAFSHQLT